MARELRQVLAVNDIVAYQQSGRIASPFAPIVRSGAVPRPEMLARAATAWEARIPATGRLRLEIDLRKKRLQIRELRVLAADARFEVWAEGETELGLALVAMGLDIAPPRFRFDPLMLAAVSLHAVGRWFQRTFVNTQVALLADLRTLAMAADDARLGTPGEFEVNAGDGRWAGVVMQLETGERVLACRSFLTH